MSATTNARDLRELEAFYKRWGRDVLAFCRLFIGDAKQAEITCSKAFLDFCRESSQLPVTSEIPPRLVGFAYQAMQPSRGRPISSAVETSLENCILRLDCRERAVFIMRNVLRMSWPNLTTAAGISAGEARELWVRGMLEVRDLLPRDFFRR